VVIALFAAKVATGSGIVAVTQAEYAQPPLLPATTPSTTAGTVATGSGGVAVTVMQVSAAQGAVPVPVVSPLNAWFIRLWSTVVADTVGSVTPPSPALPSPPSPSSKPDVSENNNGFSA